MALKSKFIVLVLAAESEKLVSLRERPTFECCHVFVIETRAALSPSFVMVMVSCALESCSSVAYTDVLSVVMFSTPMLTYPSFASTQTQCFPTSVGMLPLRGASAFAYTSLSSTLNTTLLFSMPLFDSSIALGTV